MKIAFLFPGQGSQFVGMGKDLYKEYEEVRKIYKRASEISKIDIAKLCFEGKREEYIDTYNINEEKEINVGENLDLNNTENTQIAIATMSLAILEILKKEGIKAEIVTGLSLGEYPALIYSGILNFEDGIKLLKNRGYFMANYLPNEEFSMAAVIGEEISKIEEICKELLKDGEFVVPANYNYSAQTVISGNNIGVDKAIEKLNELGVKKVIKLNTSGPFHTEKLKEAKDRYSKELQRIKFNTGDIPVIKNTDGTIYKNEDNIKEILANHIISPVRFDKAIKLMFDQGIDTFIEIGPGKALTGFIKKENKETVTINIQDVDSLKSALEILKTN